MVKAKSKEEALANQLEHFLHHADTLHVVADKYAELVGMQASGLECEVCGDMARTILGLEE